MTRKQVVIVAGAALIAAAGAGTAAAIAAGSPGPFHATSEVDYCDPTAI